jgi:alpha-beta hydrolase superfamily lysophospholipase
MADAGNVILDLGIFPPETLLAWLSKDKVNQKLYIADPYNGAPASNSMNRVLIENLSKCSKKDWFKAIRHDLPVFICSGKADPIGLWSWGIRRLFLSCVDHLENMTFKLYDGRHEIHNDFCKDEVWKDLLDFCDEVASGAYKA